MGRRALRSLLDAPRSVRGARAAEGARRRHALPHRVRGARRGDRDPRDEGRRAELHPRASLVRLCPILERELREAQIRRERRNAQRALSESELRFRTLAESAPDAILTVDAVGTLLFINRAAGQVFGYPIAALIGQPVTSLIPDYRPHRPRTAEDGGPVRHSATGRHANGRVLPLEISFGELPRDGKRLTTVFVRDLAEKTRAEQALRESEERFRRAAMMSSDLVHECVRESGEISWFGDVDRILGYGEGDFPRTMEAWSRSIHPEDRGRVTSALDHHWETGEPFFEEYRIQRKDGELLHWHHTGTLLAGADGSSPRSLGTVTDVSSRREIEEALRLSEKRYRTLFERNLAGVYRSTLEGRILDCNESFARIFGYASREEVLRQAAWDFYVRPEDREAALAKLLERQSLSNYELCLKRKDGSTVWVLESESLIEGPDGRLSVIEGTAIDITERKRAEEQVKHLAFHDPLTNLPNRLLFNDRLTLAVAQAHRHSQRLAVLFLDLDRFKVINDSLGHSVGDELLRQVAERIQESVREGDTVARLGGDEFTLLVPGITAEEDAAKIARKICDAIHAPFWIDGRELFVTTSVGVSVYPSDGHDAETLVRNADSAMYRAKEQGRDNYQLYTPAMNAKAVERLSLESRLRQAVANDELELHFQPFIDLKTAEVLGAEALLRWKHPELGMIPPGEFIPIAELSGLIVPIGEWVLKTACAEARKWHENGFPTPVGVRQPLDAAVPAGGPRQPGHQRACRDRARARQARPRDHRVERDAERGALDQHALGAEEAGRAHLDGRLRHRLLVAQLPQAFPDRPHQARPVVRARPAGRQGRRGDRDGGHRDGTQPRAGRHRGGRRDRGAARVSPGPRLRSAPGIPPVAPAAPRGFRSLPPAEPRSAVRAAARPLREGLLRIGARGGNALAIANTFQEKPAGS
jgi:diguanylate cyclase (GGDEF)-like protein/PAS domain S-box-containing protein